MALDIASRTGVAEGGFDAVPRLYSIVLSKPDDGQDDAYGRAVRWIAGRLIDYRPDLVVIEAPVPAFRMQGFTNARTSALLHGLFGAIAGCCRAKGIKVERAQIRTVRKHFLGVGNLLGEIAKRESVKRCRLLGWDCPDHDAADAGAIWDWAQHTFGKRRAA